MAGDFFEQREAYLRSLEEKHGLPSQRAPAVARRREASIKAAPLDEATIIRKAVKDGELGEGIALLGVGEDGKGVSFDWEGSGKTLVLVGQDHTAMVRMITRSLAAGSEEGVEVTRIAPSLDQGEKDGFWMDNKVPGLLKEMACLVEARRFGRGAKRLAQLLVLEGLTGMIKQDFDNRLDLGFIFEKGPNNRVYSVVTCTPEEKKEYTQQFANILPGARRIELHQRRQELTETVYSAEGVYMIKVPNH